jgi:hypothetical protein
MLEVQYKSLDGRLAAKFSGNDNKEVFTSMAQFEEIFCNNTVCGHCKSENTRLNVREVEGNKYYARVCNDCQYSFSFGQKRKDSSLFPKTAQGWTKYIPSIEDGDDIPPKKNNKK